MKTKFENQIKRSTILSIFFSAFSIFAFAQNPAFQVTSTTGGFVAPSMTAANRTAIATPVTGSLVYQTDGTAGYYYYNGSAWVLLSSSTGTVTSVATGTGLSGGPITTTGTISLANTAVTAGSYGSATQVGTFTVDAQGRLTDAGNTTISGVAPGGTAGGDLSGTYPNPSVVKINGTALSGLATGILKNTTTTGVPSIAVAGTDYAAGVANPSASIGLTAVNGTATSAMRSDGAPALSQAIIPTWSGLHTYTAGITSTGTTAISLGADASANTINVGTGAAAKTVSLGSTNTTSATTINSGTGGLAMNTGAATNATTTLGTTGSQVFGSSTATSDKIAIKPQSTTTTGAFTGTITSADLTANRTWTFPDGDLTIISGSGTATQATYWSAANALTSNAAVTINPNTTTTTLGSLAVTSSSTTASTQAIYGSATGATGATVGIYGSSASGNASAAGVLGITTGGVGTWGIATGNNGFGVYGQNTSTGTGTQYGVVGSKSGATGTGTGVGVAGSATGTGTINYGGNFSASGATTNAGLYAQGAAATRYGVIGTALSGGEFYNTAASAGTNYTTGVRTGLFAQNSSAAYNFSVAGYNAASGAAGNRTGGVLGSFAAGTWASMGYQNSATAAFGLYATAALTTGTGFLTTEEKSGIAIGAYGAVIGSWTRGEIMGHISSGELFASYNQGDEYTSGHQIELVNSGDTKMAAYSITSTDVKIYADGSGQLTNGIASYQFDENFKKLLGSVPNITITPIGESNGIHIVSIDQNGFKVKENQNGNSSIQFNWIAVGKRIDANLEIPKDVLDKNFDQNMKDVMFNESDLKHSGKPIWWDGNKVRFDGIPASISKGEPKIGKNSGEMERGVIYSNPTVSKERQQ